MPVTPAARLSPTMISGAEAIGSQGEKGEVVETGHGEAETGEIDDPETAESRESRAPKAARRPYTPQKPKWRNICLCTSITEVGAKIA